jgi:uncharacterized repeat protein (TIGR03803 family)
MNYGKTSESKTLTKRALVPLRMLTIACALIIAFSAPPLHAQFFYQEVYDFGCGTDGCNPYDYGQLVQWKDSSLYGTTLYNFNGTIFAVTPTVPGTESTAWFFSGTDGAAPYAAMTLGSDGNLYGTTSSGGAPGYGNIFRFGFGGFFKMLHAFNGTDGGEPCTPPTQARDLNFYGFTGMGTTYRITMPGGAFKQLGGSVPFNSPSNPGCAPLAAALDGNLYGVTVSGGTNTYGTIFRMTTEGVVTVLYSFAAGADGGGPVGLSLGQDGNLYGTTSYGGNNGEGGIFQFTLPGYQLNPLYSFTALNSSEQNYDGAEPVAGLLAASDGYLYGSTNFGGTNTCGTLFRITTTGTFSKLAEFPNWGYCIDPDDLPADPFATLIEHTNGSLYGTTQEGGGSLGGNVYTLTPVSPYATVNVVGPIWVNPGGSIGIIGQGLSDAVSVTFAGEATSFQPISDTYMSALVPSDAVDGPVVVTLTNPMGGEQPEQSQRNVHILPVVTNLDPTSGPVGQDVDIVGGGFAAASKVTFGGRAASFTVLSPTLIQATVPSKAKTGKVKVTTPNGTATSKETFAVN